MITIAHKRDDVEFILSTQATACTEVVNVFVDSLIAAGYHPDSVIESLRIVADTREEANKNVRTLVVITSNTGEVLLATASFVAAAKFLEEYSDIDSEADKVYSLVKDELFQEAAQVLGIQLEYCTVLC